MERRSPRKRLEPRRAPRGRLLEQRERPQIEGVRVGMHDGSLEHLPDEDLLATVRGLTARSNVALADLLAHLGEMELRGLHRLRACASLYTYCVYELRLSEDAAYRRSKAARLVREYPELHDAVAKGA